jgi:hypothetical protein
MHLLNKLRQIAKKYEAYSNVQIVEAAHMELAEPSIATGAVLTLDSSLILLNNLIYFSLLQVYKSRSHSYSLSSVLSI